MDFYTVSLYVLSFVSSLLLSLILTPAARSGALLFNIIDRPSSPVKTHSIPVPYLGGVAVFLSFSLTLMFVRVLTNFPTGTLRSLRGILLGGGLVFLMGLVDDIRKGGLPYKWKFIVEVTAAILLLLFGVHIQFIYPFWFAVLVSILWIVGMTNAFNIIDIMDGLSSGTCVVACLAFLFIALPTEEIYVNFMAASLAGALLGFLPFNLSSSYKIFLGDTGSLLIGFLASAMAMGTRYGDTSPMGVLAPLLILAVPIYDTALVFFIRIKKGLSPFLGSKDHFALRLEKKGWSRKKIVLFTWILGGVQGTGAFALTRFDNLWGLGILSFFALLYLGLTIYVLRD